MTGPGPTPSLDFGGRTDHAHPERIVVDMPLIPPTDRDLRKPSCLDLPDHLSEELDAYLDEKAISQIRQAFNRWVGVCNTSSEGTGEGLGEPSVEVAATLARLRLDCRCIVAGLLYYSVEKAELSLADVQEEFGDDVATIVEGVTKLGATRFRSGREVRPTEYRGMLLAMANDLRAILVKIAGRLQEMRTLTATLKYLQNQGAVVPDEIALEARAIYAPIATRLGMREVAWELEDLCFKYLEPREYKDLRRLVKYRRQEREWQILDLQRRIEDLLRKQGIPAEVTGRPKHFWSIHREMARRGKPFDEIDGLLSVQVITDSVQNCYAALGLIYSRFTPIQDRFQDYIATPKSNMYRSLHGTVFGPHGRRYEIQIRTEEMHNEAEHGIAAPWRCKDGREDGEQVDEVCEALSWFRQVLELRRHESDPEKLKELFRFNSFSDRIFVFTRDGDLKTLPKGSNSIDFAFAIHTKVGLHCDGAMVNHRPVALFRKLQNGDTVEIATHEKIVPQMSWLDEVETPLAKRKIRQWIHKQKHEESVKLGKEFLDRELKKLRVRLPADGELARTAESLNYPDFEHVMAALGRGDLGPSAVIKELFPDEQLEEARPKASPPLQKIAGKTMGTDKAEWIQRADNLRVRSSQCCLPVPGDDVIGYVTAARGISVHRKDCPNILNLSQDSERRVEIEWTAEQGDNFFVKLITRGTDRRGLLSDIAKAINETGTDIHHADIRSVDGGMLGEFVVELEDRPHLSRVMGQVEQIKGLISVECGL